jgi:hypothetical protein
MGGGCVCDNYIRKFILNSNEKITTLENGQNIIQNKSYNKISNKTSHILYNILESKKETKDFNKRNNDYHNIDKNQCEIISNIRNTKNKINNSEEFTTSINGTCFFNIKYNNNEETTKKIYSNNNSSFFNESKIFHFTNQKKNEIIEEGKSIINNKNDFDKNNNKHKIVMKKIKDNQDFNRKSEANINYNLGDHNFIFINISRGKSFLTNKEGKKYEAATPKMTLKKDNLEEVSNGKGNLFSHFCKNRMTVNTKENQNHLKKRFTTNEFIPIFNMNKYSEEMLSIINSIRTNPQLFIKHIDELINNNIYETEEGAYLISNEVDEKIKLMDNYIEMFDKAKNILKEKMDIQKKRIKLVKMVYNEDLEISLEETDYLDYYYAKEFEEQYDENKEENNIKNLPFKLGLIYDYDEINILDDDSKEDINEYESIKPKENLDIIDFDEENNSEIFTKENSKNKVVGVTDHYKIIISNNDINSHQKKYKREKKLKKTRKIKVIIKF